MPLVDVYSDGRLSWVDSVPCEKAADGRIEAKVKDQSADAVQMCLLNEPRVRNGRYQVPHYVMEGYYHDDGPPGLDQILEACRLIEETLKTASTVTVICPEGAQFTSHRNFSALCVAAHSVIVGGKSADAAFEPWKTLGLGFMVHCWASIKKPAPARSMSLLACLQSLALAMSRDWLNRDLDVAAYRNLVNQWDVTWVVPGQILLLADPMSTVLDPDPATPNHLDRVEGAPNFVSWFVENGVRRLVRLNQNNENGLEKSYDPAVFTKEGMEHVNIPYDDVNGGVPPKANLRKMIAACADATEGATAYHCKAGFGRSGVCAAVHAIHKYDVPGELLLAWLRIVRPGTITTPQQARFLQGFKGRSDLAKFLAGEPGECCVLC
eukprot:TRINITY_DN72618_c0_g1_i1.p1 TRINITY_DN72618_c0_g1~~TRINITY_DN72618_c0_g1_i1.p1  ORF type:complete len:380 (-),score=53.28 TRINITY_DN72618_c0_g1_i1:28-1167(-)